MRSSTDRWPGECPTGRHEPHRAVAEQIQRAREAITRHAGSQVKRAPGERPVDRRATVALQEPAAQRLLPLAPIEEELRVGQHAGATDVVEVQVSQHDGPDRSRLHAALTRLRRGVLILGDTQHEPPREQWAKQRRRVAQHARIKASIDEQRTRTGVLDQEGLQRAPAPAPGRDLKAQGAQLPERPRRAP